MSDIQNKKWGQWAEFDNKRAVDAAVYGTHIPFGRVVWNAQKTVRGTNIPSGPVVEAIATFYERAEHHAAMLPHEDGDAKFTNSIGEPIEALSEFVQYGGETLVLGVSVESSVYDKFVPLAGLDTQSDGQCSYGAKDCDAIPVATHGAVYVPVCTDVQVGNKVGYIVTPDLSDETQGYGVIGNLYDATLGANMVELVGAEFRTNAVKGSGATVFLSIVNSTVAATAP